MCGASQQKGMPASALGTLRSSCELVLANLPGREAWALVGILPAERCPGPWAGRHLGGGDPHGPLAWEAAHDRFFHFRPQPWKLLPLFLELITCSPGTQLGT